MEPSTRARRIAEDTGIRNRIEALVKLARWQGEGDPAAPVPVDQLAWAVAADPDITAATEQALAEADEPDRTDVTRALAGATITDDMLTCVITKALARLEQPTAAGTDPTAGGSPATAQTKKT